MTKYEVIKNLKLESLDIEGGFFNQVYKSKLHLPKNFLPETFKAESYTLSTCIYYLLGCEDKSKMHAISADETWHFYKGSDSGIYIDLLVLHSDGGGEIVKLGSDILAGQVPQYTVIAGDMMGARISSASENLLMGNGSWALVGATVSPSFEYADFIAGDKALLAKKYPRFAKIIEEM